MSKVILLDSGPLGTIVHPKYKHEKREYHVEIREWLEYLNQNDFELRIPEIIDYELRRNLLLENLNKSIDRLDLLQNLLIPLERKTMLKAAQLWAEIRKQGKGGSHPKSLDGDAILVAQAIGQKDFFEQVIIVTTDLKDLSRFPNHGISIYEWPNILTNGELS
ncbi:PIN domain-containing protein [Planktothrix serta PCC 8927]|uniref:PIN domain-containing protein n=1 Tax=Planktothrix serta PCC 8927 TaxID=671068 RepID=A0A7Z9C008_9CYAN|nr:hypothetical protein [Planktothrix serta]VXD23108.1 PIN domain-containing protein [Planktothrix serta PCC 8927]